MSLRFSYANLVGIRCGRNIEKLVGGFADKAPLLDSARALWRRSYLASWFHDVPFQLHSVFPGAFSPEIPVSL